MPKVYKEFLPQERKIPEAEKGWLSTATDTCMSSRRLRKAFPKPFKKFFHRRGWYIKPKQGRRGRPTRQRRRRRLRLRRRPALSSRRLHLPTLMLLINTLHSYVTRDFIQLVVQPDYCRQCFETVYPLPPTTVAGWRRGIVVSGVRRMNEVNALRARLVPGWVTDFGRVYHLGM